MEDDYICDECGEEITVYYDEMNGEEVYDGETGHKEDCDNYLESVI